MTPLRQRMSEDMQVRNLALNTQRSYLEQISRFARHFGKSPELLGPEEIRGYQLHLTQDRRLSPGSVLVAVAAIRFLYKITLKRDWNIDEAIPACRKPQKLPVVMSPEEVNRFLLAVKSLKHRVILTVCYAAGLRISEAVRLTPDAIDSQRMVIRVEAGKAAKGDSVVEETRDPATGVIGRRTPSVVQLERPPLPAVAKQNWSRARKRLLTLKAQVEAELSKLEQLRQVCLALVASNKEMPGLEAVVAAAAKQASSSEAEHRNLAAEAKRLRTAHYERQAAVTQSRVARPGFMARLFRSSRFTAWSAQYAALVAAVQSADRDADGAEVLETKASAAVVKLRSAAAAAEQRLAAAQQTNREHRQHVAGMRSVYGTRIVDEEFFAWGHEASQKLAPWVPDRVHRMREDLFIAAMDVHRAFMDAAAQKVMHNLGALMSMMSEQDRAF